MWHKSMYEDLELIFSQKTRGLYTFLHIKYKCVSSMQ